MNPHELQALIAELQREPTTTVERACVALKVGRTLGYQLARQRGLLCEGVPVLRVGRLLRVPTAPLLAALGCAPLVEREDGQS